MSEAAILWLCVGVGVFGLLIAAGIVYFGLTLFQLRQAPDLAGRLSRIEAYLHEIVARGRLDPAHTEAVARTVEAISVDYNQRRAEVATTYAQLLVAAAIVVVLAVLLITNVISAEAGLPILSGISGFVIAKGPAIGRTTTQPPPERRAEEG
jgi:hypothetical protein